MQSLSVWETSLTAKPPHAGPAERKHAQGWLSVFSRRKLPSLFPPSPITPPTRHLGKKGGMSNGKP